MQALHLLVNLLEGHIVSLGRLLQFLTLGQQVVICLDGARGGTGVHVKGDIGMLVLGVSQEVPQHTQQLLVGFQLDDGIVGEFLLGHGTLDLHLVIDHVVPAPEGLNVGLAASQSLVDERQSLVNELGGVDGFLVLLALSALVVQVHEPVEDVDASRLVGLGNRQVDAIGLLGGEFNLHATVQLLTTELVTINACREVTLFTRLETVRSLESEYTEGRLDGNGQGRTLDVNHFFLAELGFDIHQSVLVNVNLELQGRGQGIKKLLGSDNLDRRAVIVVPVGLEPTLVLNIGAVELELLHHLGAQFL